MEEDCIAFISSINILSQNVLIALRFFNSCIAVLNIIGNAFLIFALKRTGQTSTLSLQLVIVMSLSDLITGVTALSLTNILLLREYDSSCFLKSLTQFIHMVLVSFSFGTVFVIALDRYLHMKYLHRYSMVMSKRRGYALVLFCLLVQVLIASVISMPFLADVIRIAKIFHTLLATISMIIVFVIYYKACKTMNSTVASIRIPNMHSSMHQNKTMLKAAASITICMGLLISPFVIANTVMEVSKSYRELNVTHVATFKWFTYIGVLANGVCSSLIFILQNRPVRRLLQSLILHKKANRNQQN